MTGTGWILVYFTILDNFAFWVGYEKFLENVLLIFFGSQCKIQGKKNAYKENSIMGKRVLHKKFGEGVVISSEGSDSNTRVQVSFDEVGIKWLILAVANLEII